jgi:hypothetical protein
VYGLTAARFPNKFKDPRNLENIVAKRGALFMVELRKYLESNGIKVIHIKTDSIKIFNIPEHIEMVHEFGRRYGYTFEFEDVYEEFNLLNRAVYIARSQKKKKWIAVGAEFAHPIVYKTLFSHEPFEMSDYFEVRNVTGNAGIYLDLNENLPPDEHKYQFVGRIGQFVPVRSGCGGGLLYRRAEDGKLTSVAGTKGYRWKLADRFSSYNALAIELDFRYSEALVDASIKHLEKLKEGVAT